MKVLLLGLFVVAVAAAPKDLYNQDAVLLPDGEVIKPEPAVLPEPELPVIPPAPAILPEPQLPVIPPEPAILPEPELPVIPPEPAILPEPQLPLVPEEPIIVPEPIILPMPIIPAPVPVPINGEVFNDGVVQVSVNAPEDAGVLASINSWISMILNYVSNGIQSSYQILG